MYQKEDYQQKNYDKQGKLEVIIGCMFSGKSEELIRRLRRAEIASQKVICIKPSIDTRYSDSEAVSHVGTKFQSVLIDDINKIYDLVKDKDVIGIEETQFFSQEIVVIIKKLLAENKRIIACGLDLDCFAQPFEPMPELMCESDKLVKLTAICVECKGEATRSQLLINNQPAPFQAGRVILVSGSQNYEARCRNCHIIPNHNI